ncbi:MAG: hypothetical protein EA390_05765 [Balneolaceae bacterium]|nr:MAG: hypothetical protein EA390_05765 [Balneolaceae bacterium]
MKTHIVIIGDLEESKKLKPDLRLKAQRALLTLFDKLNSEPGRPLSSYSIILGDEFQAVYEEGDHIFRHIWTIMAQLHPVLVRWSIGVGEITTPVNRQRSFEMDGPAFHRARERMEMMKKEKSLISIHTADSSSDKLLNSMFRILSNNLRGWNKNRFLILQKLCEGKEVKQIAAELGLSEVAIYKNINAGSLDAIQDLTDSIVERI